MCSSEDEGSDAEDNKEVDVEFKEEEEEEVENEMERRELEMQSDNSPVPHHENTDRGSADMDLKGNPEGTDFFVGEQTNDQFEVAMASESPSKMALMKAIVQTERRAEQRGMGSNEEMQAQEAKDPRPSPADSAHNPEVIPLPSCAIRGEDIRMGVSVAPRIKRKKKFSCDLDETDPEDDEPKPSTSLFVPRRETRPKQPIFIDLTDEVDDDDENRTDLPVESDNEDDDNRERSHTRSNREVNAVQHSRANENYQNHYTLEKILPTSKVSRGATGKSSFFEGRNRRVEATPKVSTNEEASAVDASGTAGVSFALGIMREVNPSGRALDVGPHLMNVESTVAQAFPELSSLCDRSRAEPSKEIQAFN